ncbi:MAG: hypothetical protein HFI09_03650 [Bacilli bacterium]|nr:hypothetical protein [Bacilli bacterium]
MNELMKKYGGLILFYGIIVLGVLMLNERFRYLNQQEESLKSKMINEIAFQN